MMASGAETPIAVGGVGGSGTRVIAQILEALGCFVGDDLNGPHDNLWFTLLFKYREIRRLSDAEFDRNYSIFRAAMAGGGPEVPNLSNLAELLDRDRAGQHNRDWLEQRVRSLRAALHSRERRKLLWGWKEPNTHMVIDRLTLVEPELKYIHVARNGLDMAFSSNQNQLKLWGPIVFGKDCAVTPANSLRYWRWAHERVLSFAPGLGSRFMLVNFDKLCAKPEPTIASIARFANAPVRAMDRLVQLVRKPPTIKRHSGHITEEFDDGDVAFVRQLGFDTD